MPTRARRRAHRLLAVPYEKHVLGNGLEVVLHVDRSNPVVAVYVCYHVGSAREEPRKSGFAHLFEHMLFQGSEHVQGNDHFRLVSEAGGALNGNTTTDRTLYFETLPSNQLELALWLEADRMGFLLPAMTQEKLDNQRDVVLNERRQSYENRPYGQVPLRLPGALYPPGHPYSWPTIGSAEDIRAATLADVRRFFERWYGPNNATLAVGGDLEPDQALAWVERYFGAIPRGPGVRPFAPRPAPLARESRIVLEDRVHLPQLVLTWPTVERGHADAYPLELLAMLLSQNKAAVLDRALMVEQVLAREVYVTHHPAELAGRFSITATAAPGVDLGRIEAQVRELLVQLLRDGIDPEALARMQTRREAEFVRALETVSARTAELALANTFTGNPASFLDDELSAQAVTAGDVRAVLGRYLVGRPALAASVVPLGRSELAAPPPEPAPALPAAARDGADPSEPSIDRAARPAAGPARGLSLPAVWHDRDASGLAVTGVLLPGSPLSVLRLAIPGGRIRERPGQSGLASLTAELLEEGTQELSTTELTEALDALGANLWVRADDDEITCTLTALDRHLPAAARLLASVVLSPRLAREDFERLRTLRLAAIDARADQIQELAADAFRRLLRGPGPLGAPLLGSRASVAALGAEDAVRHQERAARPAGARLVVVGDLERARTREVFEELRGAWDRAAGRAAASAEGVPAVPAAAPAEPGIYLLHKPGAAQSELRVGHPSVSSLDPAWFPLQVLNYVLGGNFTSRINLNLREDKGYTYGARSFFEGGVRPGAFAASAAVATDVTAPALAELLGELERIVDGITPAELEFARAALTRALQRQYEGSEARLALGDNVSRFGWPDDYPRRRVEILESLGTGELGELARSHVRPSELRVLVVGDRERVRAELEALSRGPVRELDPAGHPEAAEASVHAR
jgi:zinc protease